MNEDVTENDLIAMDPVLIMEWIDHVSRERPDLAAAFNWLGTAEAAQLRVYMPETPASPERLRHVRVGRRRGLGASATVSSGCCSGPRQEAP